MHASEMMKKTPDYPQILEETAEGSLSPSILETLKQTRQNQNKTFLQIGKILNIPVHYLEAIEQGDLPNLPEVVYTLGFVRSYAQILGLNGEHCVKAYKEEILKTVPQRSRFSEKKFHKESMAPKKITVFLSLLFLLGAYATWTYMDTTSPNEKGEDPQDPSRFLEALQETQPMASENKKDTPLKAQPLEKPGGPFETNQEPLLHPSQGSSADVSPQTSSATSPQAPAWTAPATGSRAATNTTANTTSNTAGSNATDSRASESSLRGPAPVSEKILALEESPRPHPSAFSQNSSDPYTNPSRKASGDILVMASARSWIEVKDHNRILYRGILDKGETYKIPLNTPVFFSTGNAGGIRFSVHGRQTPVLGAPGQVMRRWPITAETLNSMTPSTSDLSPEKKLHPSSETTTVFVSEHGPSDPPKTPHLTQSHG